jgi:CheY-like chemotaxis protein
VAKILVADDNSNVQKTVTLALADLGIEVIAVNNGEAAVRKMADVSPDLVLADIFMPVRNGYEVCEFVKKDSRFSRVPVVLLVGAFDPLDEREAQRVGADGILKKPFVPPDPLIAMVKMLLERSMGDRLVSVGASKSASERNNAGGVATSEEPPPPIPPSRPRIAEEFSEREVAPPAPAARVSFGEGHNPPVAFSQLLETPAVQEFAAPGSGILDPVENEQILTNPRDASLGDPIFWKTEEPEVPAAEENSEADPDLSSGLPMRAWKPDEESQTRAAAAAEVEPVEPVEPLELVRERSEDPGQASTIVETSTPILQDAAAQASLNVEAGKPEDLAANPIEWMASVPPPAEEFTEPLPEASSASIDSTDAIEANEAEDESNNLILVPESVEPEFPAAVVPGSLSTSESSSLEAEPAEIMDRTPAQVEEIPDAVNAHLQDSAEDTAHSLPKEDWADLADSLHLTPDDATAEAPKAAAETAPQAPEIASEEAETANSARQTSKSFDQSAEDTARAIPKRDWADLTANLRSRLGVPSGETSTSAAAPRIPAAAVSTTLPAAESVSQPPVSNSQQTPATTEAPAAPDPVLVEAVVQRILEKMRPQVVDIITKEFLRPIVQALVHREILKH